MSAAPEEAVLRCYERMAEASTRMRLAALAADWDALIEAETECARHVARLRALDAPRPATEAARARRASLIRQVLADDAQVRAYTQPWLGKLETLISGHDMQRRLDRAYG